VRPQAHDVRLSGLKQIADYEGAQRSVCNRREGFSAVVEDRDSARAADHDFLRAVGLSHLGAIDRFTEVAPPQRAAVPAHRAAAAPQCRPSMTAFVKTPLRVASSSYAY